MNLLIYSFNIFFIQYVAGIGLRFSTSLGYIVCYVLCIFQLPADNGYLYALSKRTDLYAAYADIDNRNGATFTVGNATERGSGDRALNLGIRHNF